MEVIALPCLVSLWGSLAGMDFGGSGDGAERLGVGLLPLPDR